MPDIKRVLIIGGGFGGVAAALALEKKQIPNVKITLVSDKPHHEYHAALYRVVTGKSPLEVCIPLLEIIGRKKIEFVKDNIQTVDFQKCTAKGTEEGIYHFDYLILALGSETAYFNIPGIEQFAYGFKSITQALRLKRHLHELFEKCKIEKNPDEKMCLLHFVIVGAGASGIELAGELSLYAKKLALKHKIDPSLVTLDLIEGAPRILPTFSEHVSEKISQRLKKLGINIFANRPMEKEELEKISVRGMTMKTETVIWTAGIKPNSLYSKIQKLHYDSGGRVLVDEFLQARGLKNIYVIGDGASTLYSGMAQTAIHDGILAAENIMLSIKNQPLKKYHPKKPYYSIPVGTGWAATLLGPIILYGSMGWFFRKLADLRYFLTILPFGKAITAFQSDKTLCESCEICKPIEK